MAFLGGGVGLAALLSFAQMRTGFVIRCPYATPLRSRTFGLYILREIVQ